ncbi:MAG: rod shape-determining protein MreD [Bacteroidaceae bacterium]|jgi:rod shape-determining protein MreD|nr:rod shape-determining protein MreD [Bacteroidaceae bacterium]MBR2415971.1 rod shape-determining protein MreD [Bacteroidaceae bacterium]
MTSNNLIRIRNFVILAFIQVLIFSQIHLFGYATAHIYLIFLLKLPRFTSRNEQMLWAFLFGLVVDIFGNTPGINACAATAMAFARGYILESFTQKGVADDFVPGIHTINVAGYIMYATLCLLLFYSVLFLLELFTIHYPLTLLASIAASTLLTLLFTLVIECFTRKK